MIGAGPSGLFAAVELARHGVRPRIVESTAEPHHQARATAIQPGTLEILARAGVSERILAAAVHLPFARVFDADLTQIAELAFAGAGCRWEFQCSLPQWRTEQILAERLAQLGVVVERGVTARSLQPHDDRVVVALERSDGARETIETRYLVGAGGAHSVTRASMAQELMGETYPGTALVADIRARCRVPRDNSALVATAAGYVLLAPLPAERWITFVGDLDADELEHLERDTLREAVAAAIHRRITGDIVLDDVAWGALFQMHNRVVPRLAGPRRFLLGDAGHLSSPFGGEGLNSGLHDAHNLAWKLALVLSGHGRPPLLESFAAERLAADRHVLEVSDRLHAMANAAVTAARTGVRPAPPTPEQVAAVVRSRSMLDVSYADSPIVGSRMVLGDGTQGLHPGERYPDWTEPSTTHQLLVSGAADEPSLARLRHRWRALVDVVHTAVPGPPASSAVLVRPDGHIAFASRPADAAGVAAIDAHLNSYLVSDPVRGG